jgi:pyruvate dehydrogenase E2 component (dihydrolipoamide acetyltransferase)
MNVDVETPDLGTDNEQGTVMEWHFDEGEYVEQGEVLLEISTESGPVEVTAPQAGVLLEQMVDEDEVVHVGDPVAILDCGEDLEEDEDDTEVDDLDLGKE